MQRIPTRLRLLYACVGVCLLVYGLRVVLVREIGAEGSRLRGAGWIIQGEPAILIGFLLGVAGAYILYLAFNRDD